MIRNGRQLLQLVIGIAIVSGILFYIYFEARGFVTGPTLTITSPTQGTSTKEKLITITGETERVSTITLNDRPIFIDEDEHFSEHVLLLPGYNLLTIGIADRFGRTQQQTLEIVSLRKRVSPSNGTATSSETASSSDSILQEQNL